MIGITRVGTNDLARARSFYEPIFSILDIGLVQESDTVLVWGKPAEPLFGVGLPFNGEPATFGNGTMVAFPVGERSQIDAIYAKAVEMGGKDEGPPGPRGNPANGHYVAYMRDLDGNKICFFHRKTS